MGLIILTFVVFAIIFVAMAVGYIFRGKCLAGSCGGQAVLDANGELLNCEHCPVRKQREANAGS